MQRGEVLWQVDLDPEDLREDLDPVGLLKEDLAVLEVLEVLEDLRVDPKVGPREEDPLPVTKDLLLAILDTKGLHQDKEDLLLAIRWVDKGLQTPGLLAKDPLVKAHPVRTLVALTETPVRT